MNRGKTLKKIVAVSCVFMFAVTALAGCGKGKKETSAGDGKLTWWMYNAAATPGLAEKMEDSPFYKELNAETGIDVEFIEPSVAGISEQFNLMVASEALPDIIQYSWGNYPGGPSKAIKDNVIIDLNEYKQMMPNLQGYFKENIEAKTLSETYDGKLPAAPFIRGDESLKVSNGVAIRKDWLRDLNLELPETIEEWETVLTAFKEQKGAEAPLQISLDAFKLGYFTSGFNTIYNFYQTDGKIRYGMLDDGFKDFLICMNDWYEKGLINKDCFGIDGSTANANILNGVTGATNMSVGGGIGSYMTNAKTEGFELTGAKPIAAKKGEIGEFGMYQSAVPSEIVQCFTAISADCKNVELACKLLDFGYSDKGHMLYNFGVEGESYNMVDGYPKYTELITNNPNGYAMSTMLGQYCCSYSGGPFVQDKRYMEQYGGRPQQQEAWHNWEQSNMKNHAIPALSMFFVDDEQSEFAKIKNDIDTYSSEMIQKMIMGTESIDNYDDVIKELKTRKIDKAIEIYQKAYNRYLKKMAAK